MYNARINYNGDSKGWWDTANKITGRKKESRTLFVTSLSSFPNLKKKTAGVFSQIITELAKPHTVALST